MEGELRNLLHNRLVVSHRRPSRPVAFIEQKCPDFEQLREILSLSVDSGYWSNFGPVSSLLEASLEHHLHLPPSRAVVMCSSGTAALVTALALKEYRAGRRLRWVVSAYGFRSSRLGPLADAKVLDCDSGGMLDLDALAHLDPQSWDGAVVTNVFGLKPDARDYVEFCRAQQKALVIDNAGMLDGFLRDDPLWSVDEILSFHQTKPWGMGEGGCAVIPREHVPQFRALINGAEKLSAAAHLWASNSKISEVSCALILQRLLRAQEWSCGYQEQARRILRIALASGLRLLAPMNLSALTPPHLPMLAPSAVTEADLANESFVMQKYYAPLSGACPVAAAIYANIVNIPCHPGMALLRDEEIQSSLDRLLQVQTTRTG